jgi:hypothetical protein
MALSSPDEQAESKTPERMIRAIKIPINFFELTTLFSPIKMEEVHRSFFELASIYLHLFLP